jgi:ABC-type multidrug transport system fused ATPase/permease subunit
MTFALFSQGLLMITEYWPRWWASASFGHENSSMYVWALGILTTACIVVGFYRALVWFQFTLKASSNLHERALWAVLHSPQYFFVANPTGRILNRFAKDQSLADEAFPFTLFDAYCTALFCLSALLLVCISIPWLILIMPPLIYLFGIARRKYLRSAVEIKRIEAVSRSPIYADFSATLEGLSTLRAYKLEAPATLSFQKQLDRNSRAWFAFLMVSRWLGFRLDLESAIVLICITFVAVSLRDTIDVGLIGFAIVYTLSLSGLLQWTVRQTAEVESQMTSIERINSYAELPPEPGYSSSLAKYLRERTHQTTPQSKAPASATRGAVDIKNITVRYRDDFDPVITGMSLSIPAGSKVGICGRTGCGKSSTLLALLRLNIISSGDILVDGESLLAMDLETARSMISVIPQDPHLFSGTVRFNLDPFGRYSDTEIWAALEDSHIKEYISSDPLGLSKLVEEGGKNFSVGQRQLLSLARAILRRCKVVLMDEVTASIDYATDRLIQETIRSSDALCHSTIITVAHRLRTIADSDLVVVMGPGGNVAENGEPADLLAREDSLFRGLAEESNEIDEILAIAVNKKGGSGTKD